MPAVLLLTTAPLPVPDDEIEGLAAALEEIGVSTTIAPWAQALELVADFDLVVIRSTWDYFVRLTEFDEFLDKLPWPLMNPKSVVRWNWHKGYLLELIAAGVPVITTEMVSAGSRPDAVPAVGGDEVIIKPAQSAGAIGVGRFPVGDIEALAHLRDLALTQDVLVQPFVPEVARGEISLMFTEGEFSHAVIKVPADGDFRVQENFGGVNHLYTPTEAELAVAGRALALVPEKLLYARVDLVNTADGPRIMELELIEPSLFLWVAPGSTERLAEAIKARL